MSKPLSHSARFSAPAVASGAVVKHVVRMALFWLCATILLWSNQHPLAVWKLSTVLAFWAISSIVVPALGLLASWFRGRDSDTSSSDSQAGNQEPQHSIADTLGETGLIGVELLTTLMVAVAVEHLLF